MPNISKMLARVFVSDLDAAIPLYEELAQARAERFGFRDVELARVGPFLLLAGNTAAYRDWTATIQVASLVPVLAALKSAGGEIVEGRTPRRTVPGSSRGTPTARSLSTSRLARPDERLRVTAAGGSAPGPPQRVVWAPPLTCKVWPVMWRAPSEARNHAVSAMSPGCPARPSWVALIRAARRCSVSFPRKKPVPAM